MTRTLTTEQLRARAAAYRRDAETLAELGDTASSQRLNESANAFDELAANREAQPVAWRHDDGPFAGIAITRAKSVADSWIDNGWTVTPLYTAPPAPGVPDERSAFESFIAERFGGLVDLRRAKNGDNEYMAWDMAMAWIVWQRRAAMLAAAPEGK